MNLRSRRPFLILGALLFAGLVRADEFEGPLDTERWEVLRIHDTRADRVETADGKLVLALDTIGTDDATVKLRGIRSRDAFAIGPGALKVSATIDWNAQANGCYLTAGFALVPESFSGDPRKAPEAIAFEWVGVPPGKNVRPYLTRRKHDSLIELYTEGWPQPRREDRVGRAPVKSTITVEVGKNLVKLIENEKVLWSGTEGLPVGKWKLVVFVTGHSNYPMRTVLVEAASVAEVRS